MPMMLSEMVLNLEMKLCIFFVGKDVFLNLLVTMVTVLRLVIDMVATAFFFILA